jgi:hypothetical protein
MPINLAVAALTSMGYAGILLGPTALGRIPGFSDRLFPKASLVILKTVADFALIFFMVGV